MAFCKQCLLPDVVKGADLDAHGVCSFCTAYAADGARLAHETEQQRKAFEADLEKTLAACPRKPGQYDCVVPFSGGKDSVYLLHKLKNEYKLNVLAFTVGVDLPEIAWDNIRRALQKLNIDHEVYTPPEDFLKHLFRYVLANQSAKGAVWSLSYAYASLFESQALKIAIEKKIPLVLAGYSPGQPEPERILYEFSDDIIRRRGLVPRQLRACGEFDADLWRFYDPKDYPEDTVFPRYLAPFHAWRYNQEDVMRDVVSLGLVRNSKQASPIFSNYPIHWLLMHADLKQLGYNPYVPEFCQLIREGKAERSYWRFRFPLINSMIRHKILVAAPARQTLDWLNMTDDDLKITLPADAYDPL